MRTKAMLAAAVVIVMAAVTGAGVQNARAVLPPGNTAEQWDKIAEDTVVGSGGFQNEGLIHMAYASNAMSRPAAAALQPGVGDSVQRAQDRRGEHESEHCRDDGGEVLDRQRDPAVQPAGTRRRDGEEPGSRRHRAARRDGQYGWRGRPDLGD